ncbi:hypothetical protein Dimus_001297, partial [Dionaea muscipula]
MRQVIGLFYERLEWITKDFVNSNCIRDFFDHNVNEARSYFDKLTYLSRSYYHVDMDVPPSPSVAFDTEMANDSASMWVSCDAMPAAFVEFDISINYDGDSLEMCDEVVYSPFVKLFDQEPHVYAYDSWSGQALDGEYVYIFPMLPPPRIYSGIMLSKHIIFWYA